MCPARPARGLQHELSDQHTRALPSTLMAGHTGVLILRLKEKFHKTSVVVTHDTHLGKKLADRIVFLHEGRVAYFGPWAGFESAPEPFLHNFLRQDQLIPALDVIS